jgi:VanZ family protein
MKKNLLWVPALGWMGVIFYLSHQPARMVEPLFPHQDKVFHFIAYFLLASFFCVALKRQGRALFLAVIFAALYGITDEIHQGFVPGRDVSLLDWLADFAGALTAFGILKTIFTRWRISIFEEFPRNFR